MPDTTDTRVILYRRDVWTAIGVFLFSWVLFAALEQRPFRLQGAVVEALVERGRLSFVRGHMKDIVFENLDTNTPSFKNLFNVFPYGGVYHVNHAPGQFLLAAPWYAAAVKLGWRFETDEHFVWRLLVWTLTAPLGALGVMCVFILARKWDMTWMEALLAAVALGVCSPWWAAAGVLYHDSIAVALILIAVTVWLCRSPRGIWRYIAIYTAGLLLAYSIVTTYLVVPIVLLICGFLLGSRASPREAVALVTGFLPIVAILPITNFIEFGSFLATGYSAGGFDENYPSPFDVSNAWEKVGFYLWHAEYGLFSLFPVFLLGAFGLVAGHSLKPPARMLLLALLVGHFLFIISMQHHGSVGWGMGRFFLPLYPIIAFGLPAVWSFEGWKGSVARALLFGSMMYSIVVAAAAAWYGVQGVMEPGVPSLKLRLLIQNHALYQSLFLLPLIAGVTGELIVQRLRVPPAQIGRGVRQEVLRDAKSRPAKTARRNRRRN